MKKLRMRITALFGVLLLAATMFGGWDLFYPKVPGTLFSYTRGMAYLLYFTVFVILLRVYKGCDFGKSRVRDLAYSQMLSAVISAVVIYTVAVANSRNFLNPLPVLLILLVQLIVSCAFSFFGNWLYYKSHKPKKTIVLYRDKSDLERIEGIEYFDLRFSIEGYIENPIDIKEILPQIEQYEVVFVVGVEATLRNGVVKHCIEKKITGYIYPHIGDVIMMSAEQMQMFSSPMVRVNRAKPEPEYLFLKRVFDVAVSLLGIMVSSPFMLITAIAIKLYDGGPVFYKQVRLTKDAKQFKILKFRSMRVDAEKDGIARLASDNDSRITPVGKIIRACRIDELPQLFNILKGDMSIVGPRPERPEIAAEYEDALHAFNLRLQCKAGLTGYAQVYGKYNTEPRDKLKMDLMYIHNMSILEDLKICFYTLKILFIKDSTKGVADGQTTAIDTVEKQEARTR